MARFSVRWCLFITLKVVSSVIIIRGKAANSTKTEEEFEVLTWTQDDICCFVNFRRGVGEGKKSRVVMERLPADESVSDNRNQLVLWMLHCIKQDYRRRKQSKLILSLWQFQVIKASVKAVITSKARKMSPDVWYGLMKDFHIISKAVGHGPRKTV